MGGWGLGDGRGGGEAQKTDLDDLYEDVEGLDWDKTQVRLYFIFYYLPRPFPPVC
jgi:hypothetical protein